MQFYKVDTSRKLCPLQEKTLVREIITQALPAVLSTHIAKDVGLHHPVSAAIDSITADTDVCASIERNVCNHIHRSMVIAGTTGIVVGIIGTLVITKLLK
jgi:hypothetical protein